MTLADIYASLTTILIVLGIFMLIVTILFWVVIEHQRRILVVLHLIAAQLSEHAK